MRAEWFQHIQLFAMGLMRDYGEFSAEVKLIVRLIVREGLPEGNEGTEGDSGDIPWAAIYHKAREIMGMSDDEFWRTSPRKYFALLDEALIFRGIKKGAEPEGFLDDVF